MSWILPKVKPSRKGAWVRKVLLPDTLEHLKSLDHARAKRWRDSRAGREWYAANRERKIAYCKNWRTQNPDKIAGYESSRPL